GPALPKASSCRTLGWRQAGLGTSCEDKPAAIRKTDCENLHLLRPLLHRAAAGYLLPLSPTRTEGFHEPGEHRAPCIFNRDLRRRRKFRQKLGLVERELVLAG